MPRDGSGVYSLPAGNPVVTNTVITSNWANSTLSDIAAQLNNVFTRDGLLGPTAPFKVMDGTVAAPGLAWNSEPGLGFYRSAAGHIKIAAGGSERVDFDGSSVGTIMTIKGGGAQINLNKNAGTAAAIYALNAGSARWGMTMADGTAESGGNVGNDFVLSRYSDAGAFISNALVIARSNGGAAFTGTSVSVNGVATSDAQLSMNKSASGRNSIIYGLTNNVPRWYVDLGNATAEAGGNAGSDFTIVRFNDGGAAIDTPFTITRSSGAVAMSGNLNVNGALRAATGFSMNWDGGSFNYLSMGSDNSGDWRWSWNRNNGDLRWNRSGGGVGAIFDPSGNFACGSNAYIYGGTLFLDNSGSGMAIIHQNPSGGYPKIRWTSDNWRLEWSGGTMTYYNNTSNQMWWVDSGSNANVKGKHWQPGGGPCADNSDERIKENIRPWDVGLDAILSLNPVSYNFKAETGRDTAKRYIRLIAQQAKEGFPELVSVGPKALGDIHLDDMHDLDEGPVLWALVNAVKTLNARISQLEAA